MKRKIAAWALGLIASSAIMATPDRQILTVTTGTNATATVTDTNTTARGYIDQIDIDVVTAATTGTVSVAVIPELSTMANVVLVTETNANSDLTYRPRFDDTDTSGTALTSDPPGRLLICGDTIMLTVSNASATGIVFKAVLKYEKE
ncbi:MAG: hypothetical protein KKD14_01280 [Verrucomicrobia bacterium]|nr:hypothetical protein [Verrucomicrobiota bacterium]MCG2680600.1 hypothetical protein [Kiritimatiellia bacterium]